MYSTITPSTTSTTPSSSSTVVTSSSAATTGNIGAVNELPSQSKDSSGLSGGGIAGVVIGVLCGLAALGLLIFALIKRRRNRDADRGYGGAPTPFGGEKERPRYRDSSVPIHDSRGESPTYDPFAYPPGNNEKGPDRPETMFTSAGNFAGVGRSHFVVAEEYDNDPRPFSDDVHYDQDMRQVGGAAATSRNLTSGGAYERYSDQSPPLHQNALFEPGPYSAQTTAHAYYNASGSPYHGGLMPMPSASDDYHHQGRDSPTDYYGQAVSPAVAVTMAEEYGDFPPANFVNPVQANAAAAPNEPSASPLVGGLTVAAAGAGLANTRSLSPIEHAGRDENTAYAQDDYLQRQQQQQPAPAPKPARASAGMPQLPPLSLDQFDTSLEDGQPTTARPTSTQGPMIVSSPDAPVAGGANLNRKSSSAQPKAMMYGSNKTEEELRKGYADLARAAEIEPPAPRPTSSTHSRDDNTYNPSPSEIARQAGLMSPPTITERYQHGRPLSTLVEMDTPATTTARLSQEGDPFGDSYATAMSNSLAEDTREQSQESLEAQHPIERNPARQASDTLPASDLRPAPVATLPVSPASSVPGGNGIMLAEPITPRALPSIPTEPSSHASTPDYAIHVHPPAASAGVEPEVPSSVTHSPAGSKTKPVASQVAATATSPSNSSLAAPLAPQSNRLSVASSFSDAYDGI